MTDKSLILDAIQKLPDDSTVNDIREQLEFIAAVQVGLRQVQRGEVVSLDDVEHRLGW